MPLERMKRGRPLQRVGAGRAPRSACRTAKILTISIEQVPMSWGWYLLAHASMSARKRYIQYDMRLRVPLGVFTV